MPRQNSHQEISVVAKISKGMKINSVMSWWDSTNRSSGHDHCSGGYIPRIVSQKVLIVHRKGTIQQRQGFRFGRNKYPTESKNTMKEGMWWTARARDCQWQGELSEFNKHPCLPVRVWKFFLIHWETNSRKIKDITFLSRCYLIFYRVHSHGIKKIEMSEQNTFFQWSWANWCRSKSEQVFANISIHL